MSGFRVLHLRASNFVGGPEHQLLRYAESERGGPYEVILGSFVSGGKEGSDFLRAAERRGIQVLALPTRNFGSRSALPMLVRELEGRKINLLCTHGFKADVLGVLASRSPRIPIVCFLRGWTRENRKVRVYEAINRLMIRFADRVVCLSQSQAAKLSGRALSGKLRVVRNAIDTPAIDDACRTSCRCEVRRRFGLSQNCLVVASAGRLSPEKGTGDFLVACSILHREFADARFLIFGEGVLRKDLELKASQLGIRDQAIFVSFQRDLRRLLPGIDLLVHPSHSEEMPNIVLEAMAAGIPIVATAVGALEEIAGPEHALHLVPPAKPKVLAGAIRQVLADHRYAKQISEMGRERAEHVYSLTEQRRQLHALYSEFVKFSQVGSSSPVLNQAIDGNETSVVTPSI